jgi:hypothetical protein
MIFEAGDMVEIWFGDRQTIDGIVLKASANGKSLLLMFDGTIGKHAGAMPVLKHDDGVYRSIFDDTPVQIAKEDG